MSHLLIASKPCIPCGGGLAFLEDCRPTHESGEHNRKGLVMVCLDVEVFVANAV